MRTLKMLVDETNGEEILGFLGSSEADNTNQAVRQFYIYGFALYIFNLHIK